MASKNTHLRGCVAACALILCLAALWPAGARAQGGGPLYFPATGHHLDDEHGFLAFWRDHDGERRLGFPISEALPLDGATAQYFERGRLEQQAAADGTSRVVTGRVGSEYAEALWKRFAPAPPHKPIAGEQLFESTGHTTRGVFLSFWKGAGGLDFFGAPISEISWELVGGSRRQVQYFERARLERDPEQSGTADEVRVSDLGRALAALRGIDITPVANVGYESYGPSAPLAPDMAPLGGPPRVAEPPVAVPVPQAAAPTRPRRTLEQINSPGGEKSILVNLSSQWLYAYEGDKQVFDAPVSTGRDGMETPTGNYAVYAKLKVQTMDGVLDGQYWVVPNVPNVMYINGGVALHGTYWHNRFGSGARLSHGCVNLPLGAAAWLYDWAPMGTPVRVTY